MTTKNRRTILGALIGGLTSVSILYGKQIKTYVSDQLAMARTLNEIRKL